MQQQSCEQTKKDVNEFSPGDAGRTVVLTANGVRLEIMPNGNVLAYTKNKVRIMPAVKDSKRVFSAAACPVKAGPEVGDRMPDGTIYAGISPDTGKPMYAAPADAPQLMDSYGAAKYAKELKIGDKEDFRVPSTEELDVLYQQSEKGALKGTFNRDRISHSGWYLSSSTNAKLRGKCKGLHGYEQVHIQDFDLGQKSLSYLSSKGAVRAVR